jgi:hypothetical protein
MSSPVSSLKLSVRTKNALIHAGIKTVQQLVETPAAKLLSLRCFGVTSMREVEDNLSELGLKLVEENTSQVMDITKPVERMAREIYIGCLVRGSNEDCDFHFDNAWNAALHFEQRLFEKRSKNE